MNVLGAGGNLRSAFLGLERWRKSEGVPKWSVFGTFFAIFGEFFAKIERNRAVFEDFEKERVVIALSR